MKVLIIRFSSIGDIVLTTPVIRALKTLDSAEVHFATKSQYADIITSNRYVDKVHLLGKDLNSLITGLKAEEFDVIIDLHHNLRTWIIKFRLGIKSYSFNKLNWQKWLMVHFKINRLPSAHIVDRYLDTLRELKVTRDDGGLDFFIPEKDRVLKATLPESHRHEFVAYAIGGQHATKKLPVERIVELCRKTSLPVILLGGKEDFANGETVVKNITALHPMHPGVLNACGIYNLNQSASILEQARFVFSHDTGMMHIAAALGKQIFAIWGNTIPGFGMTPYRTVFTNLENNNLSCRPCSKIGFDQCPQGHFKCMRELSLDGLPK